MGPWRRRRRRLRPRALAVVAATDLGMVGLSGSEVARVAAERAAERVEVGWDPGTTVKGGGWMAATAPVTEAAAMVVVG